MPVELIAIYGPMFSGKTTQLLAEVERAEIAGRNTLVIKPSIDDRGEGLNQVCVHSGTQRHEAIPINTRSPQQILTHVQPDTNLVAIDEAQFFRRGILRVVQAMLDNGVSVVVGGLPTDFRNEGFGAMPELIARANRSDQRTAICTFSEDGHICGRDATRTQRFVNGSPANYNDPVVVVGAQEMYAARCSDHHIVPGRPVFNKMRK